MRKTGYGKTPGSLSRFQNPTVFLPALGKSSLKSAFPFKPEEAVAKIAILQPPLFFLVLFFISLPLSCASISPLATPPDSFPLRAAVPGELTPQWEAFAPGIDYFDGRIGKPRLELWAIRVDLGNPDLEFVVNGADQEGEGPRGENSGIIPSTTVSGFVRNYGCIAGINTNPFDPVSAMVGEDRTISGITLADGILIAPPHPHFDALVFYNDGSAAIVNQAGLDAEALGSIRNAVGGFSAVLWGGVIPERLPSRKARHPRSAAGLSENGKTLYLLTIDGRRLGSVGATEEEIGVILTRLGADDGLNFDGGGSTALILRYPDGKIRPVNTPIHGMIP
ncbi:MAG: phosphodiester glycosidase family protein, partial [Treponema sp.]|nr:phosphodiester glycosidase family protein [Treponema sp.]